MDCQCERCKAMCANSTCLPTPEEARELIRRGYGPPLAAYHFAQSVVGPAPAGKEGWDLPHTLNGPCTFYKDGLCEIHAIKPREGRLSRHDVPWLAVRFEVLSHWKGKAFESVMAMRKRMVT